MSRIVEFLSKLWKDESAELTVEYGLLVAVVAIGLIAVFILFRDGVMTWFSAIVARIQSFPT